MRVLVVDDQEESYQSLLPTLRLAHFQPEHAGSAEAAYDLASRRVFDLFLVDLQMPPGNWGGLEVIKHLHADDAVAPIIVVSGRGTLAECITAIRLGAKDYIKKETFQVEFNDRIVPLFGAPYAIGAYPSLIGYLHKTFREERSGYLRARRLIDVFELTLRLIAVIILIEQWRAPQDFLAYVHESGMDRPTLGSYVSFVFSHLSSESKQGDFLNGLRASDFGQLRAMCDEFTKCRNENFGHSVTISAVEAAAILRTLEPKLTRLLNALSFFRRFQMFAADSLKFDGTHFAAEGRVLTGENLQDASSVVNLNEPVPTGHVVLLSRSGALDLDPLLVVRDSGGDRQCYAIFDKVGAKGLVYSHVPREE